MKKIAILFIFSLIVGFTKPLPQNSEWNSKARQIEYKWGVPIAVQMAFKNESLPSNTAAKMKSSSAQFSQRLQQTWTGYRKSTGSKERANEFATVTNFIG